MDTVIARCCGLDVHRDTVVACVRIRTDEGKLRKTVRTYRTTTGDLSRLAAWLANEGVTHVAMESTGVYWKPVFNVLDDHPFTLLLCNARHVKRVPGRKTDVTDAEWLAELLQYGLLKPSFVPARVLRELRDLTRLRTKLQDQKTAVINRLGKILEDANVKLGSVATDIMSASGRDIIQAIIAGQQDPAIMAQLARGRMRAKIPELELALEGRVREHHRFLLKRLFGQIRFLEEEVEAMGERIKQLMTQADQQAPPPPTPPPGEPLLPFDSSADTLQDPPSERGSPTPGKDTGARPPLTFADALALISTIPGLAQTSGENILAEIGLDMSQFPTAKHLASWAGQCPGNNESGGRKRRAPTRSGNRWLSRALGVAALSAGRVRDSYYKAALGRWSARRGGKRAIVAVSHSLLVTIYAILSNRRPYQDLGPRHFDQLNPEGHIRYHVRRLQALGCTVTIEQEKAA